MANEREFRVLHVERSPADYESFVPRCRDLCTRHRGRVIVSRNEFPVFNGIGQSPRSCKHRPAPSYRLLSFFLFVLFARNVSLYHLLSRGISCAITYRYGILCDFSYYQCNFIRCKIYSNYSLDRQLLSIDERFSYLCVYVLHK